jgi:outer membrane receptor protein involved in Fe transport
MGVYNIFDLSYWDPQVTRGTLQTASGAGVIGVVPLELYRAPGRTFAVNAVVRW